MLKGTLTRYKVRLQGELFPVLRETFGALSSKQEQLVTVLGLVAVESFLPHYHGVVGRPEAERAALARAFIAKAVYNLPTTRVLLDMLRGDGALRRICGWERRDDIPGEATFSRSFALFADTQLPARIHAEFIKETLEAVAY